MYSEKVWLLIISLSLFSVLNVGGNVVNKRLRRVNWGGNWYMVAHDTQWSREQKDYCPLMSLYEPWEEKILVDADYCVHFDKETKDADYFRLKWPRNDPSTTYYVKSREILPGKCYDWEMRNSDNESSGHIYMSQNASLSIEYSQLFGVDDVLYPDCPPDSEKEEITTPFFHDDDE